MDNPIREAAERIVQNVFGKPHAVSKSGENKEVAAALSSAMLRWMYDRVEVEIRAAVKPLVDQLRDNIESLEHLEVIMRHLNPEAAKTKPVPFCITSSKEALAPFLESPDG